MGLKIFLCGMLIMSSSLWGVSLQQLSNMENKLNSQQKDLFFQVADQLRCPTCIGLSVMQSDAEFSLQIREAVLEQVQKGNSQSEIIDFFTARYGLWILRKPPSTGFHSLAWWVPILMLVLGIFFIWFAFWRKEDEPEITAVRSTEEILREMDTALKNLRSKEAS